MKSIRTILVTFLVLLATTSYSYAVVLTTTFASNNGNAGNFFDVITLGGALDVSRLDLNLEPGTHSVSLFTRNGTWVGNNNNPAAWTLVGTGSVTSAASDSPSPFNIAFVLPGSSTTGIYVVADTTAMNYTNGTGIGNLVASNADLQILEGAGAGTALFPASFNANRIWNGSIVYELASTSVPEVDPKAAATPLTILALSLLVLGCRRSRSGVISQVSSADLNR